MGAILAKVLLMRAQSRGWRMTVLTGGDHPDYVGTDGAAAWAAVEAVGEAHVRFAADMSKDGRGEWSKIGSAFLMVPGPGSCEPDESIADHSGSGVVAALCDAIAEDYERAPEAPEDTPALPRPWWEAR